MCIRDRFVDVLGVRSFPSLTNRAKDYEDHIIQKFMQYATVPILSLESAIRHPLQSFADFLTIREYQKTSRPKVVLSWAPHPKALPQAVANSFLEWMHVADVDLTITHPEGYELSSEFAKNATIDFDQNNAITDADFIYTKNWSSYADYGKILTENKNWKITNEKMALTNDAKFMHCLPVRRNVVVADEVLDSANSLVINQANNRTFAAQAALFELLKN